MGWIRRLCILGLIFFTVSAGLPLYVEIGSHASALTQAPPPSDFFWTPVNWDPNFTYPQTINDSANGFVYWRPAVRGSGTSNVFIGNNTLHIRQNDTLSTGWRNYDNAVAHQGQFPWMNARARGGFCEDQDYSPDWDCPLNTHGLRTLVQTNYNITLTVKATFLAQHGLGDYNIIVGLYFWFVDGPQTARGYTFDYLEAQIRLAYNLGGIDQPIGTERVQNATVDFLYAQTVAQPSAGQNITISDFDVTTFYRRGLSLWGIDPNVRGALVGVEPGTEGWGVALSVLFQKVELRAYESNVASADTNMDHVIDTRDLNFVTSLLGKCPIDLGSYVWIADVNSTNACIDNTDLELVVAYQGFTYQLHPQSLVTIVESARVSIAGR